MHKLNEVVGDSKELQELKSKFGTLTAMVKVHISGEYRAFSTASLLMIVFALVYFITPTDVIPDFIPAVGFTDDATVLYMIYRKLNKDIEAYLKWSAKQEG